MNAIISKHRIYISLRNGKKIGTHDLLKVLMLSCTLADGITFRDIMKLISAEKETLSRLLFDVRFPEYYDYLCEKVKENPQTDNKFSHIEIYKCCGIDNERIGEYWGVKTMSQPITGDENGFKAGQKIPYGFFGVEDLELDLPIRIGSPHIVNDGKRLDVSECKQPSLYDILYAVFYEISFHGSIERTRVIREKILN